MGFLRRKRETAVTPIEPAQVSPPPPPLVEVPRLQVQQPNLLFLRRQFEGVPSPTGDFGLPPGVQVDSDILMTRYGLLVDGDKPTISFQLSDQDRERGQLEIDIQYTCFDEALDGEFIFTSSTGVVDVVTAEEIECGRIGARYTSEEPLHSVAFRLPPEPRIFAIHRVVLSHKHICHCATEDIREYSQPYSVICFSVINWDFRFQRPQHLLQRYARDGHRVVYIETDFVDASETELWSEEIDENITRLRLPGKDRISAYLDAPSPGVVERGMATLIDYLEEHGHTSAVMLVHLPFWHPYAEMLKEQYGWKVVYDCIDDHSGFEHSAQSTKSLERNLLQKCDYLTVTSQLLYDKVSSPAPKALVRNAGEFMHFAKLPRKPHPTLQGMQGPVVGYFGALAEWFDVDSIAFAAQAIPEAHFVLIGQVTCSRFARLEALPNVHLLGEIAYDLLPQYIKGFDVCLIPFLRIPLTEATNPVKVYEYLAAGKPVVARDLPEVQIMEDVVELYSTAEQMVEKIRNVLQVPEEQHALQRQQFAFHNTWADRYRMMAQATDSLFPLVGIVVVSYGELDKLRKCIRSILRYTEYPHYKVFVVDNNSTESVQQYLAQIDCQCGKIEVIQNDVNAGFAAANNQALKRLDDAETLILLNNDTEVTPGWVSRLRWYSEQPDVGLVGPVTNWIGNEAMIPADYESTEEMLEFAKAQRLRHRRDHFDIAILAMFCVAIRREVFEQVGLLDEDFGIGMFEDDDYANRIRQAGYRVVCAEDIFIHHVGKSSFKKMESEAYQALFERNKKIYEKKWGTWTPHVYRK